MKRRSQLVCQQLENISSSALEKYQDIIRLYIRGRNGVYALYKDDKLYYVGLATNLRSRLKQHLKDRHKNLWNRFSVYLTIGDHHIRELESLLLRIIRPSGNKQIGKFASCENLNRRLARDIKMLQKEELTRVLGRTPRVKRRAGGEEEDRPVLAPYVSMIRRNRLRAIVKGKIVRARVRKDGSITIRLARGKKFNSPSLAAVHVLGRNRNGWDFWSYERSPGEWVRLTTLRE